MKYYHLKTDTKKTNLSRIAAAEPGYKTLLPNSQGSIKKNSFSENINFSKIILTNDSVVADVIEAGGAIGGVGYVVNEKVKNLLSNFVLPDHKYYELPLLEVKGEIINYYWFQVLVNSYGYRYIDFEASTFLLIDIFRREKKGVKFSNQEELKNSFMNLASHKEEFIIDKVTLNSDFVNSGLAMTFFHGFYFKPIVNQEIKDLFEKNGITGVVFQEVEVYS